MSVRAPLVLFLYVAAQADLLSSSPLRDLGEWSADIDGITLTNMRVTRSRSLQPQATPISAKAKIAYPQTPLAVKPHLQRANTAPTTRVTRSAASLATQPNTPQSPTSSPSHTSAHVPVSSGSPTRLPSLSTHSPRPARSCTPTNPAVLHQLCP